MTEVGDIMKNKFLLLQYVKPHFSSNHFKYVSSMIMFNDLSPDVHV